MPILSTRARCSKRDERKRRPHCSKKIEFALRSDLELAIGRAYETAGDT